MKKRSDKFIALLLCAFMAFSLIAAAADVTPEPCAECGAAEGHSDTCSQYVAPVDPETPADPEPSSDPEPCTECGYTDGHSDTCSQYVAPVDPETPTDPEPAPDPEPTPAPTPEPTPVVTEEPQEEETGTDVTLKPVSLNGDAAGMNFTVDGMLPENSKLQVKAIDVSCNDYIVGNYLSDVELPQGVAMAFELSILVVEEQDGVEQKTPYVPTAANELNISVSGSKEDCFSALAAYHLPGVTAKQVETVVKALAEGEVLPEDLPAAQPAALDADGNPLRYYNQMNVESYGDSKKIFTFKADGLSVFYLVAQVSELKSCTCEATDEEKADPGFVHQTDCPLFFDPVAAKEQLFAFESLEDAEIFAKSLSEKQAAALAELITEDEILALAEKWNVNLEIETIVPPTNFTAVGPLMPAVSTISTFRLMRAAARQVEDDNGLILNKYATYDEKTNTVTITMEAYTTGTVTSSNRSVPVDVVLVLDESRSMKDPINQFTKVYTLNTRNQYYVKTEDGFVQVSWCNGGLFNSHPDGWYTGVHFIGHWGTRYEPMTSAEDTTAGHVQFYAASATSTSKQQALISAANKFANSVYADADNNNVDHRISVIGFSGNNNSHIKVGLTNDIRNNIGDVRNAINTLNANGGTYIEDGLANAVTVFDNAAPTTSTERKRVVVIFTDGIPGSGTWNNETINGSANPAISSANTLKNTYGATVYTIGMLDDANPGLEISDKEDDSARTNKFLHYLSSNYPNAKSMSNGGSGGNNGYYLSAGDTASLDAIFTKIAEEISTPSIRLTSEAVIKDVVTPTFTVPTADKINIYTEDYNGTAFVGERHPASGVEATVEGDTLNVTGFDYNANFISENAKSDGSHGKKLIIEFTVQPKEGFLGGNDVPTNGATSGLYENGSAETALETFPIPTVNVPIKDVTVDAVDKNVYLLSEVKLDALKNDATVKVGDVTLNLSKANDAEKPYGLEKWQTEYVNIKVEIKDKDGKVISTDLSGLTDDATYTLAVTVSPKTKGTNASGTPASAQSGNDEANIKVYKPELTYKDSEVFYGDPVPTDFNTNNRTDTKWKHGNDVATADMGTAPALSVTYTPEASKISDGKINSTQDIQVAATVKIGSEDVTTYTTFVHTPCDPACGWNETVTPNGNPAFLLHVKTASLIINKTGADGNKNEGFIFNVTGPNNLTFRVSVEDNGSVKITGLPLGTYTVTEDEGWSWRYTAKNQGSAELTKDKPEGTVTIENAKDNYYLLDGNDYARNNSVLSAAGN